MALLENSEHELLVYGGAFDPIHNGHLRILVELQERFEHHKIIVLPTQNTSVYKKTRASFSHRYNMIEGVVPNDILLSKIDEEYNCVNTHSSLKILKQSYPNSNLTLVLGDDNLNTLSEWEGLHYILSVTKLLIINRVYERDLITKKLKSLLTALANHKGYEILTLPALNISSSMIREKIKNNKSVMGLVHPHTINYINKHICSPSYHHDE